MFQCSGKQSDKALLAEYSSYNISQPCPNGYYVCSTGLCIRQSQRCDGSDDCFDESDEVFCCRYLQSILSLKVHCNLAGREERRLANDFSRLRRAKKKGSRVVLLSGCYDVASNIHLDVNHSIHCVCIFFKKSCQA
uniref:Uncharacterized protein n=1 Tax=Callorhinchus milii TaxID=7868 RepID=A0A4W3K7W9_CALMI